MMKNDDIIIVKHGKEYDKESEFLDEYPIAICPECLGSATYIVKSNMPDRVLFNGHMTGDYCYHRKGIFITKQVNVNYKCDSCECAFRKWYDVKEKSTRVSGRYSAIIISGLIFIFSIIAIICAKEAEEGVLLSNGGYYTDEFMLWNIGSIVMAVTSFFVIVLILWLRD